MKRVVSSYRTRRPLLFVPPPPRSSSSRSLSLSLSLFGLFSTGRDGAFIFNASRPRAFSSGTRVSSRFVASRERSPLDSKERTKKMVCLDLIRPPFFRPASSVSRHAVDVITPYPTRPCPRETFRHGCRFASRREKSRRLKRVSGGVSIGLRSLQMHVCRTCAERRPVCMKGAGKFSFPGSIARKNDL